MLLGRWRPVQPAPPSHECLALLTCLPLRFYREEPILLLCEPLVLRELRTTDGLFGYAMWTQPLAKRFWTLSAWEGEASLQAFIQRPPHLGAVARLAPHLAGARFLRWSVRGAELPLSWGAAMRRFGDA